VICSAWVATALALALSACTPSLEGPVQRPDGRPATPVVLTGWATVDLPGGLTPATVAAVGGDVLVGGSVGAGAERAPALVGGSADGSAPEWQPVRLQPSSPYG
jgi:hypothetical protein